MCALLLIALTHTVPSYVSKYKFSQFTFLSHSMIAAIFQLPSFLSADNPICRCAPCRPYADQYYMLTSDRLLMVLLDTRRITRRPPLRLLSRPPQQSRYTLFGKCLNRQCSMACNDNNVYIGEARRRQSLFVQHVLPRCMFGVCDGSAHLEIVQFNHTHAQHHINNTLAMDLEIQWEISNLALQVLRWLSQTHYSHTSVSLLLRRRRRNLQSDRDLMCSTYYAALKDLCIR